MTTSAPAGSASSAPLEDLIADAREIPPPFQPREAAMNGRHARPDLHEPVLLADQASSS